jgi:hypothetical protein
LPAIRLLRGVTPDMIFLLLPDWIAYLEHERRRVECASMRLWAEDLVVGRSSAPPPWPNLQLTQNAVEVVRADFTNFAVTSRPVNGSLSRVIRHYADGVTWRPFAADVLELLSTCPQHRPPERSDGLRAALIQAATADLRAALDQDLGPAVELALKAVGWPLPWSPFAEAE